MNDNPKGQGSTKDEPSDDRLKKAFKRVFERAIEDDTLEQEVKKDQARGSFRGDKPFRL